MSKPPLSKPPFMPSPRPRPRTSPEDARQLAAATGDLGFTRPSNAPDDAVENATKDTTEKSRPSVKPKGPKAQSTKDPVAPEVRPKEVPAPTPPKPLPKASSLKFEVPDAVWVALRQEALNRRVTVRYLVLEALAAKGYGVDLSTVPEDGRRLR